MKKKLLFMTLILTSAITGCNSSSKTEDIEFSQISENSTETEATTQLALFETETTTEIKTQINLSETETVATESTVLENEYSTEESTAIESETAQNNDLTFEDLSQLGFSFMSGAGGWSEEFNIERDGYFTGQYHDSEMGIRGEGYDSGSVYFSSYSGHFTDLIKINDYTYQMKLADITYDYPVDTAEIKDDIRYIYTESYCLGGTDTFNIYLKGTPVSELSEEVYSWLHMINENESKLTFVAIADEANGYGIYSYKRLTPLEDAQINYNSYKDSYDYYDKLLSEANSTMEMKEYSGYMYDISDDCLNYIWGIIKYNTDETKYNEILTEQREWISEKEAKVKEIEEEYNGATLQVPTINITLAEMTIKRCEELIEYLK